MTILIVFGQRIGGFDFDRSVSPSYHLPKYPDAADEALFADS
jgi:hypothetical protein